MAQKEIHLQGFYMMIQDGLLVQEWLVEGLSLASKSRTTSCNNDPLILLLLLLLFDRLAAVRTCHPLIANCLPFLTAIFKTNMATNTLDFL